MLESPEAFSGGQMAAGLVAWSNSLLAEIEAAPIGVLDKLSLIDTIAKAAEARLAPWAAHASRSGKSWTEIGTSLELTRQGAHQRYGNQPSPDESALALWGLADHAQEMTDPAWELAELLRALAAMPESEISRAAIARYLQSDVPTAGQDVLDVELDALADLCEDLPDGVDGQVLVLFLRRLAGRDDEDLSHGSVDSLVREAVSAVIAAEWRSEIVEAARDEDWTSDWLPDA